MRPLKKWSVGDSDRQGGVVDAIYRPYGQAVPLLQRNFGCFCCYCEVFDNDLQLEHIIPKSQDPNRASDWDNFLLACSRCNGADNKGHTQIHLGSYYFPHLRNTLLPFNYKQGGKIEVAQGLAPLQQAKAENTLKLLGLDKYPGNPQYPQGIPPRDKRWEHRRRAWEKAVRKRQDYRRGQITDEDVAEFAYQRGFFSVWFSVFADEPAVKQALIERFEGTAVRCFDPQNRYLPIPRMPQDNQDPI